MYRLGFQLRWLQQAVSGVKQFRAFLGCESGVVSLEWVAIAAVLAVGSIVLAGTVMTGLATPARNIAQQLSPAAP